MLTGEVRRGTQLSRHVQGHFHASPREGWLQRPPWAQHELADKWTQKASASYSFCPWDDLGVSKHQTDHENRKIYVLDKFPKKKKWEQGNASKGGGSQEEVTLWPARSVPLQKCISGFVLHHLKLTNVWNLQITNLFSTSILVNPTASLFKLFQICFWFHAFMFLTILWQYLFYWLPIFSSADISQGIHRGLHFIHFGPTTFSKKNEYFHHSYSEDSTWNLNILNLTMEGVKRMIN